MSRLVCFRNGCASDAADRRGDLRAKNAQIKATKRKSFPDRGSTNAKPIDGDIDICRLSLNRYAATRVSPLVAARRLPSRLRPAHRHWRAPRSKSSNLRIDLKAPRRWTDR
jgi:hypothetical protein